MNNRRPYIAEVAIKPGCAVMQGTADNKVRLIGDNFIGIYSFEANETKNPGEPIGIVIEGVAKALAGGTVQAGKQAAANGNFDGSLVHYATPGCFVGIFLESGSAGDYVDVLIQHDSSHFVP